MRDVGGPGSSSVAEQARTRRPRGAVSGAARLAGCRRQRSDGGERRANGSAWTLNSRRVLTSSMGRTPSQTLRNATEQLPLSAAPSAADEAYVAGKLAMAARAACCNLSTAFRWHQQSGRMMDDFCSE